MTFPPVAFDHRRFYVYTLDEDGHEKYISRHEIQERADDAADRYSERHPHAFVDIVEAMQQ